jgi:hypothetical protein
MVQVDQIGWSLREVLEGRGTTSSISPTDFVMDLHDAAAALVDYLSVLESLGGAVYVGERNSAAVLLPIIRRLEEVTRNKYALTAGEVKV